MELLYYLRVLRRRWVLVAASVLLALTAAAFATLRAEPVYASSITLVVSAPDDGGNASAAYQGILLSQERAKSYAKLIRSRSVTDKVAKALRDGLTAEEIQQRITAEAVPQTVLLRVTVTDGSPILAMQIAHTLGTEFASYASGLESAHSTAKITIADDAEPSMAPVSPRPLLNLALGLVIGLLVGTVAAILRELTDTSVTSVPALREAGAGAVLGVVGAGRGAVAAPASGRTEAFRSLAAGLRFGRDGLPGSLVVTGAVTGEGASTVARGLAVALADLGLKVILVDADPVRPYFTGGFRGAASLPGVLVGDRQLDDSLVQWGPDSLRVLPDAGGVLTELPSIAAELAERADIVLYDAPPVLSTIDTAILAHGCAGAVLVTRYARTRRGEVARAADRLDRVGAQILGTVLNFAQPSGRILSDPVAVRSAGRRALAAEGS